MTSEPQPRRPRIGVLCGARTRHGPESVFLRFMRDHYDILREFDFCATGGTAQSIVDIGLYPEERVEFLNSGSRGGVVQLTARVAKGEFVAVLFLTDPRDLWADVPENRALKRVCIEKQVHLITTRAGADEWAVHEARNALSAAAGQSLSSWKPKNWFAGVKNVLDGEHIDLPLDETTLALISHNQMKQEMVKFVNNHVHQLAGFHRILATGTTGWMLRLVQAKNESLGHLSTEAKQHLGQKRLGEIMADLPTVEEPHKNQRFVDIVMPLASGPKGGDVLIANEILKHRCHKIVFFYDPETAHPHEADIRLLERTAQLDSVYAFCISDPRSADLWAQDLPQRNFP